MEKNNIKNVHDEVKLFPSKPGVYIYYDKNGVVIYVGKAKNLFNRVNSYFVNTKSHSSKTQKLVKTIFDAKCIVTSTETEALILENQLIKLHSPKYNIKLKDDKNYPYIRLNLSETFPIIDIVRKRTADKGKVLYFGPYPNVKIANKIVEITNELFSLQRCKKRFTENNLNNKTCLYYQMKKCKGICANKISKEEYNKIIQEAILFLKKDYHSIVSDMKTKMNKLADNFEFEEAAKYRDCIVTLQKLDEHQKIQFDPSLDVDVFGLFSDDLASCLSVLSVRNGKITDNKCFLIGKDEIMDFHTFPSFMLEYYNIYNIIPPKIFVDKALYDKEELECLQISTNDFKKVKIHSYVRGENYNLIKMAQKNAYEYEMRRRKSDKENQELMLLIANTLKLEVVPEEIEAYDVSNSGSDHITGGMIRLSKGIFDKKNYRSFNIDGLGIDDYSSMAEMIERRIKKSINNDSSFVNLPDLFLIDGGVGHVNTVKYVLSKYNLDYIPVIGMIKDDFHKTRCLTDGINEISIAQNSTLFTFFYKIQEEVHRFTFGKMDNKRRASLKKSSLEEISGIGKQKAAALIKHFKSLKAIKAATIESLMRVSGITKNDAQNIFDYFNKAL